MEESLKQAKNIGMRVGGGQQGIQAEAYPPELQLEDEFKDWLWPLLFSYLLQVHLVGAQHASGVLCAPGLDHPTRKRHPCNMLVLFMAFFFIIDCQVRLFN